MIGDDSTVLPTRPMACVRAAPCRVGTWRGRMVGRFEWLVVAAALGISAAGCELMSGPPRQPTDGLRMIGQREPSPARPTSEEGQFKRLDLRI